jgi:hypothetical protein
MRKTRGRKSRATVPLRLVQQFYTYWQICNNQAVLNISGKKLYDHILDEIFFFWT